MLISRDLMALEPLAVVEFKERLLGCNAIYKGTGQARRYQRWLKRKTGIMPAAYLVTSWMAPEVAYDYRWYDGDRGVRVFDAPPAFRLNCPVS